MSDSTQTKRLFKVIKAIPARSDIKVGDIAEFSGLVGDNRSNLINKGWRYGSAWFYPDEVTELDPNPTPEKGALTMKKLEFSNKREIPETGHIMAIRADRMYSYNHHTKLFKSILGGQYEFTSCSLLDTDILYNFPTVETPYQYIRRGKCLDAYKVTAKTHTNDTIKAELVKLLKNGAFIVRTDTNPADNEVLKLKDNNLIQGLLRNGEFGSKEMAMFKGCEFIQFDNEFAMFKYLYQA